MGFSKYCPSCLSRATSLPSARLSMRAPFLPSSYAQQQLRTAVTGTSATAAKYKRKERAAASKKKKKGRNTYLTPSLKNMTQFPLVDAMRYLRAAEAGRTPTSSKYEIAIRFKTLKNGPIVRDRIRLPHPVKTDLRICVIAPPTGPVAEQARAAGASIIGEEKVFEQVREGRIEFDRCICHTDSLPKLNKSGIARILGPRGLMPSAKTNTVRKDVNVALREMVGASEYRERMGVVRIAVGQLGFTPDELAKNIRTFVDRIKLDLAVLHGQIHKEIHEIVLSSTNGPGLSLNGEFRNENSPPTMDLSTAF